MICLFDMIIGRVDFITGVFDKGFDIISAMFKIELD